MMSESEIQHKTRLHEVSVIRPIIILSLVLNHSFVKIASGGLRRNDYHLPNVYQWLNWFNFAATLEMFVMISGYLFAFQYITLQRKNSFSEFTSKKVHRLLFPMLVFGILYYFCFLYSPDTFTAADFFMKLLSGCGHLWFLPMLFWCLLILWIIDYFNLSNKWTFMLLAIISLEQWIPLPFGLARCSHFLFYVYFGYYLYEHKSQVLKLISYRWSIFLLWTTYITLVIVSHFPFPWQGLINLLVCVTGILSLYATVTKWTLSTASLSSTLLAFDRCCFGIYIYHQFIFVYLYHYTSLVSHFNVFIIPWVGLALTLPVSWILTGLTLRTRIGRYLIG